MGKGGAPITVEGLDDTLRALRTVDPEAMKALRKGFKAVATPILDKAKKNVPAQPMSGWGNWGGRKNYKKSAVESGLRSQVSVTKTRANLRLVNANPAGAIFETAGSKNNQARTPRQYRKLSRHFNGLLNQRFGKAPRLLVRTWKQEKGIRQTYTQVGRLIEEAERTIEKVTS